MLERLYAASQTFRDNIRFLSQFRLSDIFHNVIDDSEREKQIMASFEDDETRLEADVQADSDAVAKVQATLTDNQAQIKTLQDALAAQKSQGEDTTAMEAALAKLESNTQVLAQLPPVPAAAVAAATGTSADAVATP